MNKKAKKVIETLKGKNLFGSKKGIALLSIVRKLTAKRKASQEENPSEDKSETPEMEKTEKTA